MTNMNNQEYEQKKRECWEEFCESDTLYDVEPVFNYAFDRAYDLGKQEKDATMQQDYKSGELECWCDFCNTEIARRNSFDRALVRAANNFAFFRGYRLCKQEKDAEDTVIQGWVARDANQHSLYAYGCNPIRLSDMWSALGMSFAVQIPSHLFPELTWESDPIEVELIIKRKKK